MTPRIMNPGREKSCLQLLCLQEIIVPQALGREYACWPRGKLKPLIVLAFRWSQKMLSAAEAREFANDWIKSWNSHDLDAIRNDTR